MNEVTQCVGPYAHSGHPSIADETMHWLKPVLSDFITSRFVCIGELWFNDLFMYMLVVYLTEPLVYTCTCTINYMYIHVP